MPKRLYYRWKDGEEMDKNTVTALIDNAISNSVDVKNKYQMQKMKLSWTEYKKIAEEFLKNIINRCKLIEEYEEQHKLSSVKPCGYNAEDRMYISYFCKSLEGEMMKWQKKYYGVRDHKKYSRCKQCGSIIEKTANKHLYCDECARTKALERYKKYNKTRSTTNRKS